MALSMGDPMFDDDLNPVFADEGSKGRVAMATLLGYFADGLISPEMLAGSINQHALFWSGTGVFHQGWQGSVRVGNGATSLQAPNVADHKNKALALPPANAGGSKSASADGMAVPKTAVDKNNLLEAS